jgi:peptidylprolyl isomerase
MLGLVLALLLSPPTDLTTPPTEHTRVLRPGTGTGHPTEKDLVKVFYVFWNRNGVVVDQANGSKWVVVGFEEMTPAWRRDILSMVVGEQRRTWVDDNSILDTELIDIIPRPETPPDVGAPPADATVTPSGLSYKLIARGPGKTHPKPGDKVLVSYTGWTTDGKLFDGCALRGESNIELPVSGGIAGWTEGIQLMTDGTKMRFWMPPKLAYAGVDGKPQGMVVFDIQLFIVSSEIMEKRGQRKPGTGPPPPAPPLPPGVH